jgi:hypothetical protein
LIDHDNLEEFADPRRYDIEDDSDTGIGFYTALAQETGGPGTGDSLWYGARKHPDCAAGIPRNRSGYHAWHVGASAQQICQPAHALGRG